MKLKLLMGILIVGLLSGCSSKSNFYQLQPNSTGSAGSTASMKHTVIGVAEVEVPGYLNKPEMVTRLTEGRIVVHDQERWADAFPNNIQSVLRHNLATLLPQYTFLSYPWEEPLSDRYRIYVTIDRFDGNSAGFVRLEGRWSLVDKEDNSVVLGRSFRSQAQGGESLDALVATQSRLLDRLSREIAVKIRTRI